MKQKQGGFAAVILIILAALMVAVGVFVGSRVLPGLTANIDNPPQFIQHDFIDLAKIYSISKYRSAVGHDFSSNGETCRSMKHYFTPQMDQATSQAIKDNGGLPPKPDGKTDIDIYSPVDGKIAQIASERMPIGEQIYIVPDAASAYTVRLFHVYKVDGLKQGMKVKAGQKIGVIGRYSTDIAVEAGGRYVSYFSVMPDSIFTAYKARGATSRDDFIWTKAYRDAHPVQCNQGKDSDQAFQYPAGYDFATDEFHLSGYVAPTNGESNSMGSNNRKQSN